VGPVTGVSTCKTGLFSHASDERTLLPMQGARPSLVDDEVFDCAGCYAKSRLICLHGGLLIVCLLFVLIVICGKLLRGVPFIPGSRASSDHPSEGRSA